MMKIGSKVKSLVYYCNEGMTGIVLHFEENIFSKNNKGRVVAIRVESEIEPYFGIGNITRYYEKDLELIRSPIDPAFTYQYCSKCDVLTINKVKNIYICCEHILD